MKERLRSAQKDKVSGHVCGLKGKSTEKREVVKGSETRQEDVIPEQGKGVK